MALPESVLAEPASSRYMISVFGGDSIFLVDRNIGQKLHMRADGPLSRSEFRRHVAALQNDLDTLTIGAFFRKHGLRG